jgi:hypothetical protein
MNVIKKGDNGDYQTMAIRIEEMVMEEIDNVTERSRLLWHLLIAESLRKILIDSNFSSRTEE